jgi:hypothetical protein
VSHLDIVSDDDAYADSDTFWEDVWHRQWYRDHYEGKTAEQVILGEA